MQNKIIFFHFLLDFNKINDYYCVVKFKKAIQIITLSAGLSRFYRGRQAKNKKP